MIMRIPAKIWFGHLLVATILGATIGGLRILILITAFRSQAYGGGSLLFVPLLPLLRPESQLWRPVGSNIWSAIGLASLIFATTITATSIVYFAVLLSATAVQQIPKNRSENGTHGDDKKGDADC
jgi:hypothetical protein